MIEIAKLNVYTDEALRALVAELQLPVSKICQDALWAEIQRLADKRCDECNKKARWAVTVEGYEPNFTCDTHVVRYLDAVTTVRRLNGQAGVPRATEAGA